MNIFVPQNVQTMGELMDLASVPYMVLAPRDGKPIVEVVQDTMLGAFRLTQDWVRIHDKTMANLQMVNSYFKGALPAPEEENSLYFTGRQAYSQILPPGLFIELRNKAGKKFKIVDSEITEGFIDKPIYHSISKGLLPVLYHDYSPFEVRRFLDNTQRLIMRWLASAGFSVGISDLVVDSDTTDRLKEAISNYKAKAYTKINDVRKGKLENNSILNNEDFFEREILNVLNDLTKVVGEIGMKKIDPKTNRMINMVKSGSKGKETNVAQMVACVGQQNVDGKRVAYGFTDRTLPHYTKYDDGPEARGFVENSFISGLTPQEVFFHAMGGREGLIDTAVKTSETGYIQRRLVKAMEDCKIYYDQTVRNATGAIVQFLYGEDGMDGTKIEKQSIPTIDMNQIQLDAMYHLRPEDNLSLYLTPEALREMEADATWAGRATQHFEDIMDDRRFLIEKVFHGQKNDKIHYPIPFERIIHTARQRLEAVGVKAVPSDLTPKYILDKIDDLKQRLKIMRPNQGIRFLHILLHIYLSPKPVLTQLNLSRATFDWITSEIERYFIASVGHPGEMVGIVAAQSFGELSTQQSCTKDTQIRVMGHNKAYSGSIGQFIDGLMKAHASKVVDLGNDSSAMDLDEDFYILSVSANEKTEWQRIKQISRHPAKGGLVRVHTRSGRTTTATLSHSFLQRTPFGIVPVLGSELKQGDRIPVARSIPEVSNPTNSVTLGKLRPTTFALDREFGWILGAYLADGSLGHGSVSITKLEPIFEENIRAFGARYNISVSTKTEERPNPWPTANGKKMWTTKSIMLFNEPLQKWIDENFGRGSYQKRVPAWVYGASREFIAGMVAGFYDGDGNVNVPKCMIRAHTVNEGLADDMILLLAHCNIFAKKLIERRKREKANKFYVIHAQHKYAEQFANMIQLTVPHKKKGVLEIAKFNVNKHHASDIIDMIPQVDELLDQVSKKLNMPGQSRTYGKYKRLKMNRISRVALEKYYQLFVTTFQEKQQNKTLSDKDVVHEVERDLRLLQQAVYGDVVWDEITKVEHLPDPEEYVYDFTIPGNESFMVDAGVLVHNTLDSFHSSGTAAAVKATSGVPRLKELLSVSKNIKTPTLLIYMKPDIATVVNPVEDDDGNVSDSRVQEAKEKSMVIMKQLETTRLLDILESTEIYWDHPGEDGLDTGLDEDEGMIAVYRAFNQVHRCGSSSPWVLRMKLNKEKMYSLGLTMMDIYIRIHNAYKQHVECLFSDDNAKELILRVRLTREALKEVDAEDTVAALKAMEHNLVHNVLLKGMKGIKKVSMRLVNRDDYDQEEDKFHKVTEWTLDTDGTNLVEILANPNIDASRTRSNDIWEIYNTLGIEAARNALQREFNEVVGDDSLNYRHMSLLLDTMTNRGTLMSVDRHGINRGDVGPLAKCSFEETTDMLIKASIFSEQDRINGVSANIMLGQLPPCGTGDHEVLLDEEAYIRLLAERNATIPSETMQVIDENEVQVFDSVCGVEALQMPYSISNKPTKQMPMPKIAFV